MNITLSEARQKALEAQEQIQKAQKQMADAIREVLETGFAPLFETYAFLGSIGWTQYTPYFNDGDACIFSSTISEPSLNSLKDIEDGTETTYGYEHGSDFYAHSSEHIYGDYNPETRNYLKFPSPDYDPAYAECEAAVAAFTQALAGNEERSYTDTGPTTFDSALRELFGDHVAITVTRDGIQVDEYQHD